MLLLSLTETFVCHLGYLSNKSSKECPSKYIVYPKLCPQNKSHNPYELYLSEKLHFTLPTIIYPLKKTIVIHFTTAKVKTQGHSTFISIPWPEKLINRYLLAIFYHNNSQIRTKRGYFVIACINCTQYLHISAMTSAGSLPCPTVRSTCWLPVASIVRWGCAK